MKSRLIIELLAVEEGKSYGYQEYVFNLLNYFYENRDAINYENIVIWCKDTEMRMFEKYKKEFSVVGFSYSNYIKRHWLQTWLPFQYKLNKGDLLFSPGNVSGLFKRCPEILTIHDLLYKRKKWIPSKLMRWQRELLVPISINKADEIVAISDFTKGEIEENYSKAKGKTRVIHNSFNFSKYDGDTKFELQNPYFLAISSNVNYKNQATILKSFVKYCMKGGEKDLVIVGNINASSEVGTYLNKQRPEILSRIVIKKHISNKELGAIYRGAACFISASKFEGLGMPVVEAMSFGLPVLLSDIPPHKEVSLNKGEYFEATDVDELTEMMLSISFGKKGYDSDIREMFSEENTSAKYVELINERYRLRLT